MEYLPQGLVHCKLPVNTSYSQWTGLEYGGSQLMGHFTDWVIRRTLESSMWWEG